MRRLFKLGPISLAVGFVLSACQEPPTLCLLSGNSIPIVQDNRIVDEITFAGGPIPVVQFADGSCGVAGASINGTTDNRVLAGFLNAAGANINGPGDIPGGFDSLDLRALGSSNFANLPAELLDYYLEGCDDGIYSNAFCEDLYDFMGLY